MKNNNDHDLLPVSPNHLLPEVESLQGRKAILLLGTDRHIGEETPGQEESRVGIIPEQVDALKKWLRGVGVFLDFYFVQGAGARAGYSDGNYLDVGGQLVFEHELSSLPSPHVFHALKEPCPYEAFISGSFIRIGAVHRGSFDPTSGLASLFKKRNFCAIFDGSDIGKHSYKFTNGHEVPIRGSMSVFAGWIASDEVVRDKDFLSGKVIVSGGGVVGTATTERLLKEYSSKLSEILIVEPNPSQCEHLKDRFHNVDKVKILESTTITSETAKDANGLILTAFREGSTAPKVVTLDCVKELADSAVIVDVSIDERGGIIIPNFDSDTALLSDIEPTVHRAIKSLGKNLTYIGDTHLPRRDSKRASKEHGNAVLPYLAVLLYLAAREGGAAQAMRYIYNFNEPPFNFYRIDYFNSLIYDLRQGLVFWRNDPISVLESKKEVMRNMEDFLRREGVLYEVEQRGQLNS